MSVRWRPLQEGFRVPIADDPRRAGSSGPQKKHGTGKKKCPICRYKIRGREDNHEKGYHHQHPRGK